MDRERTVGAIRFPALLLFWGAGLVLVLGQFDSADAASVQTTLTMSVPLTEPVSLDDPEALVEAFNGALERSEVFSGHWEPMDDVERAATESKLSAETNQVEVADSGSPARGTSPAVADVPPAVGSGKRTVVMSSDPKATDAVVTPKQSANDRGFRETTGQSVVRKTRARVNVAILSMKQEARRKIERGQILQAFTLLRASVELGRNDPEYLGLLAVSALRSGNAAEASVVYERLLDMQPKSERWWAGLALSREQQGMDATPEFEHLLALSDENSELKRLVRQKIGTFG